MKKDCCLIGTLPQLRNKRLVDEMMSTSEIKAVRFNSGVNELLEPDEIVMILKTLQEMYKKKVWIDLKGRQLRVEAWADPKYEAITLNHSIEIMYPAKVVFRGSGESEIIHTRGKQIILDSPPERAVGKGQSINIKARELKIIGYLTDGDKKLIEEARKVGLNNYMASFVEEEEDLEEIRKLNDKAKIISKIESLKGIKYILENKDNLSLMAARDDLYIESGQNAEMLRLLKLIISKDSEAICASRIFDSLKRGEVASLADYEDLELMYNYGYRNFMLGDDIKGPILQRVRKVWDEFTNE